MPSKCLLSNNPREKPELRHPPRKIFSFLLLILLACGLYVRPVHAVAYLHILSAEPNGSGATLGSQIELVFDQAIDRDTFAGSINSQAISLSQVSADGSGTVITVNPGTLTFGQTYDVVIDQAVSTPEGLMLQGDYLFSFTVDGTQPPPLPSSFHGEIHILDNPPDIGNTVDIQAPDVSGDAAVATIISVDPNLVYQVNVRGDLPDTPAKEGGIDNDLLTFRINGRIAATARWHGGSSVVLDLHPPAANAGGPYAALTSTAISLAGSSTDWLSTDSAAYAWNMNGNGSCDDLTSQTPSCTFPSTGAKTIDLKVTDGQEGEGTDTTSVVVVELGGLTGNTYDGNQHSISVSGDTGYTVTYGGSTTPPTNAGTYTVVLTTSNGGTISSSMTIDPKPASLAALATGKVYGSLDPVLDTSASGFLAADLGPGKITFSAARVAGEDVIHSPYTITPAAQDNASGLLANYSVSYTPADFTITPATASIVLSDMTPVYDGHPKSATVTTDPSGLSYNITYAGSPDPPTDPGFYAVVATITDPNYTGTTSGTLNILTTHSISLVQGWNLISFDLIPLDTSPAAVLKDIDGEYTLVYTWDTATGSWLIYYPPIGILNDLNSLDQTMGFWIYMLVADTLDVHGNAPISTSTNLLAVGSGWNLVGYASVANRDLPGAFSDHGVGTDFGLIYAYHAIDGTSAWKLFDRIGNPLLNDLTFMSPGWGYWINVTASHTWTINYLAP
jgi:hypothetical protein